MPIVTEPSIELYDGMRMPALMETMLPLPDLQLPERPSEIFSCDFLRKIHGGKQFLVDVSIVEKSLCPKSFSQDIFLLPIHIVSSTY